MIPEVQRREKRLPHLELKTQLKDKFEKYAMLTNVAG